jgi:hypothetical protein
MTTYGTIKVHCRRFKNFVGFYFSYLELYTLRPQISHINEDGILLIRAFFSRTKHRP